MSRPFNVFYVALLAVIVVVSAGFAAIRPAKITHLYYTPTAYLNDEYDLVVSLHEISYTLPQKLQIHMSLVDNIGRNCLGVRYALMDNMNIGAGVAKSFTTFNDGGHGIRDWDPHTRFGLFLAYGFVQSSSFEATVIPHAQLGYHISMGADLGFRKTPNEVFSLIGEIGSSFDLNDSEAYINLIGGVRIHPPKIPFLSFDLGVDFTESNFDEFTKKVNPYIDIIFTMKTN